jgi:hypothetical protein
MSQEEDAPEPISPDTHRQIWMVKQDPVLLPIWTFAENSTLEECDINDALELMRMCCEIYSIMHNRTDVR